MEKKEPSYTVGGMQTSIATMENSVEIPKKLENRVVMQHNNPTPGHIPRENHNPKRYMHSCVHSSSVHISQDMAIT